MVLATSPVLFHVFARIAPSMHPASAEETEAQRGERHAPHHAPMGMWPIELLGEPMGPQLENSEHSLLKAGMPSVKSSQLVAQPLLEYLSTQEAHHFTGRAFHGQVAQLKTAPHSAGVPPCSWLYPLSHLLPLPRRATRAHKDQGS